MYMFFKVLKDPTTKSKDNTKKLQTNISHEHSHQSP